MTITKHGVSASMQVAPYYKNVSDVPVFYDGLQDALSSWAAVGGFTTTKARSFNDTTQRFEMLQSDTSLPGALRRTTTLAAGTYRLVAHAYAPTRIGVSVQTQGPVYTYLASQPQEVSAIFTHAGGSANITLYSGDQFASGAGKVYWTDVAIYALTSDTFLDLRPERATVTLDESWSPFARATLTCPIPAKDALDKIDPRTKSRVALTLTQTGGESLKASDLTAMLGMTGTTRTNVMQYPRPITGFGGWAISYSSGTTTFLTGDQQFLADPNTLPANGVPGGLRYVVTAAGAGTPTATFGFGPNSGPAVTWAAGDTYQASFYVRSSFDVDATLDFTAAVQGTVSGPVTRLKANVWTRLSVTRTFATASSEQMSLKVKFLLNDIVAPSVLDGTQAMVEKVAGTRTNLIPNPSFEVNTTGWGTNSNATLTRVTSPAGQFGAACMSLSRSVAASVGAWLAPDLALAVGATYTLSAYVRAATVTRNVQPYVQFNAAGGTYWADYSPAAVAGETVGGWTRLSWTFTVPAGSVTTYIEIYFVGAAAGEVHYLDAVMLEKASSAGAYFDGSTTSDSTATYAWTGTAHASASTAQPTYLVAGDYFDGSIGRVGDPRGFPVWQGAVSASRSDKRFGATTAANFTTYFTSQTAAYLTDLFQDQFNAAPDASLNVLRTLDLHLRSRKLDYIAGTMTLELTSDEMLLQDWARPFAAGNWTPPATADLKTLVNWALALANLGQLDASSSTATIVSTDVIFNSGETLWSFLDAFISNAGLRLWCDENRVWHLNAPFDGTGAEIVIDSLVTLDDVLDRNGDWGDAVSLQHEWTDPGTGTTTTTYGGAASSVITKTVVIKRIAKAAASGASELLSRARTRGRVVGAAAVNDYAAYPGLKVWLWTPTTTIPPVLLSSVTWNFPDDEMTVTTRDLP